MPLKQVPKASEKGASMTKDEALKIALDALQQIAHVSAMDYEYQQWAVEAITAIKEALAQPEYQSTADKSKLEKVPAKGVLLAQPEHDWIERERAVGYREGHQNALKQMAQREQKPVAWKLVPIEPTDEMLKAMDECSTEGYDERLYAGHAASVYMAAVDVAPIPPQRTWVGLTDEEIKALASWWPSYDQMPALMVLAKDIQNSLKEKNT